MDWAGSEFSYQSVLWASASVVFLLPSEDLSSLFYLHGGKIPLGISRPSSMPGWVRTVPFAVTDMTSTTFHCNNSKCLALFHIPIGMSLLWRVLAFTLRLKRALMPNSEHSNFFLFSLLPCSCLCGMCAHIWEHLCEWLFNVCVQGRAAAQVGCWEPFLMALHLLTELGILSVSLAILL